VSGAGAAAGRSRQLCTFYVAGLCFGVDVADMQEVLRAQPITPVPLTPPELAGIMNLRGQIVMAVDLRRRMGLPADAGPPSSMNVIVRVDGAPVSLLVDRIGDVVDVSEADWEPPPDTLEGLARALIPGVYKRKQGLLLELDVARTVAIPAAEEPLA
jgi:purine-binding chemotaxis protein CheW